MGTQAYIMLWQLKAPASLVSVLLGRLCDELLYSWAHVRACSSKLHLAHCPWDISGRLQRVPGLWVY